MCRISLYRTPSVHVSAQSQDGEDKAVAVGQVSGCLQGNRKETSNHGEVIGVFGFGAFSSCCLVAFNLPFKKDRHKNAHFTQDKLS